MEGISTNGLAALSTIQQTAGVKQQVQVSMLKKALDNQQSQTAELLKMLEGKGQHIDIRA
jgi:hypothetical protein